MPVSKPGNERTVSTYCYQCVAGPDLLKVRIDDGVATEIMPNFEAAEVHPAGGKACVKAFGLLQKTYTPNRVLYPMKRTNPNKGREHDPGFVRISWDEALDLVADKLKAARAAGVLDETDQTENRLGLPLCHPLCAPARAWARAARPAVPEGTHLGSLSHRAERVFLARSHLFQELDLVGRQER